MPQAAVAAAAAAETGGFAPAASARKSDAPPSSLHESAMRMMYRQQSKMPRRMGMMLVVFTVVWFGCGYAQGQKSIAQPPPQSSSAPARSLHGDTEGGMSGNASAEGLECYGGLTYAEQYEQDVIGPFQVLTQRKYMLTIYGCAVGQEGDPICLREDYYWMLPVYFIGLFFMFAGLAIVCDEFFVPALEEFTNQLGISPDVAGATFMAAGGSMPELFTSFIGTFNRSDVGFAAIIGSAVFNVLFVIAVCTLASDQPLQLTWWPLFRDVMWYLLALAVVAFVFKGTSPNEIESWEAVLLLAIYIGYATFMKFNPQIQFAITGERPEEEEDDKEKDKKENEENEKTKEQKINVAENAPLADNAAEAPRRISVGEDGKQRASLAQPSTFRVGIFQLLTQNAQLSETAGIGAVTKIKGNLRQVFDTFDKDEDDHLCEEEVMNMLGALGMQDRGPAVFEMLKRIEPRTGTGKIHFDAFSQWYVASEARVAIEVQSVFNKFDEDKSGTIDFAEIGNLLRSLGHNPKDEEIVLALEEMRGPDTTSPSSPPGGSENNEDAVRPVDDLAPPASGASSAAISKPANPAEIGINLEQFEKWYQQSMFWQELHQQHLNEKNAEEGGFDLNWPDSDSKTAIAWYLFTYPIAAMMYCTMPDVRRLPPRDDNSSKAELKTAFRVSLAEFACSLLWIAFFSLCLYDWLVCICNTIGFPPEVAAVTVLAGGTSIPDLLSSYVVARQGQGDMAVSSSIGSNIFDVTVGLPLPWLLFTLTAGENVVVGATSLFSSIIILILMLCGVIMSVKLMKWKMTKGLGAIMMTLYFLFIIQQLLQDFGVINYGI